MAPFRFKSDEQVSLSNQDILSYVFDNHAGRDLDKPIYIDASNESRTISTRQARTHIRRLIKGFRVAGLKKGDCVCVHSFNDIFYSMVVLAVIGAGGIITGSNPSYTIDELTHHFKVAHVKFVLAEPDIVQNAIEAGKRQGIPQNNIWVFNPLGQPLKLGQKSWSELMNNGEDNWVEFNDQQTAENTIAALLFSSGTTGLPKAVMLSHKNLTAQITLTQEHRTTPWEKRHCLALPVFHAAAFPGTHIGLLRSGAQAWMLRRFDLEQWLSIVQEKQITEMGLVPPMAIAIVMSPLSKKYSLKSIRTAFVGAAPLGLGAQKRLKALMSPDVRLTQVWGMTECSCVGMRFPYPEDDMTASVGKLLPTLEGKLIDDDGKDITGYDVRGEICIKGPTVTKGYYENPEANKATFDDDGFMKTGDVGYCDGKTGKWYIVDRKKELIKVRGFQVAPPELENVLLSHPQIIDAAVIGLTVPTRDGELPRAYIVRRPGEQGAKLTAEEVFDYVSNKVAKYKQLRGGISLVDAIPKNPSGKILKRILRDMAVKETKNGTQINQIFAKL